ncbi:MAG: acetylpolyamine amidohydrolase [Rhodospirillaceae bacterium]|nr:acetylpolyamine amidohydrolase [Rhodospirillaceae bacterium]
MRVFHSSYSGHHAPRTFVAIGQIVECPEQPRRAEILATAARDAGHRIIEATQHGLEPVRRVHDSGYLEFLETAYAAWMAMPNPGNEVIPNVHPGRNMNAFPIATVARAGHYQADTSCPIGPGSWQGIQASADVAVSAAQALVDSIGARDASAFAYALCRPPGHHAFADQAGGFCFLNNSAIAAQVFRDEGADRVAILDVDVHHGNGTQGIFYQRADVLTLSLHGDPTAYYPYFAGYAGETGYEAGEGFNLNLPLAERTGDDVYMETLDYAIARIVTYRPDVVVVALGLDASKDDPLAFLSITTDGFRRIGRKIGAMAFAILLVQEGGYISKSLGNNLTAFLNGFEEAK